MRGRATLAGPARAVNAKTPKNPLQQEASPRFALQLKYLAPYRAESLHRGLRNHVWRCDSKIYPLTLATAHQSNHDRCVFEATQHYVRDSLWLILGSDIV